MKNTEVKVGEIVTVAGVDFIVLEESDNGVLCLTKDFVYKRKMFDSNSNNYANSAVRKLINGDFKKKIIDEIGEEKLLDIEVDLMSDDGLDDYGKVTDKVALLSDAQYRKYNRIIEKYKVDDWWWLCTPYSTPHRGYSSLVRCVHCNGTLIISYCSNYDGVRPFCIFSSSIFKS